jgi:hypothetical protein
MSETPVYVTYPARSIKTAWAMPDNFRFARHRARQGSQTEATPAVCRLDTLSGTGESYARQEFLELRVRSESVPLVIQ